MSTNILSIEYDAISKVLTVYFFSQGKYNFENVPYVVYDDFIHSKSKGQFFNEKIKGTYAMKKAA